MNPRPITIAILAMGGEGGGVLADWIVDVAGHAGYFAQATSVPGVAQRTGSTIYYLELFPDTSGREPVLALMPIPGQVDIVIASELMEAGRAVQRGLVTPDRTTLIASTHRVYSMTERTAVADGRVDSDALLSAAREAAHRFVCGDFAAVARRTRSVISAALLGALAATGALPFTPEQFLEAIRRGGVGVDASLAAFAAGAELTPPDAAPPAPLDPDIVAAAVERLTDYQDAAYARTFRELLEPIAALDPSGSGLTRETARYLALWMSYEDAIRVADLKIRRVRLERIAAESGVNGSQILRVHEYLHPRAEEIGDILPAGIGRRLLASSWSRRLVERLAGGGKIVETTSISGYLQLYALSRLRRFRRSSLRFSREHAGIREWLALIVEIAPENHAFAIELAQCPRILKGYGDTHARAIRKFHTVLAAIPRLRGRPDAPVLLRQLRDAALADEEGIRLDETLRSISPPLLHPS